MDEKPVLEFDLDSIDSTAADLLHLFPGKRVFAIYGEMGAGKTTFIKALCRNLGAGEFITSPTFAIVNEYTDNKGKKYFHFDFYRIEKIEEALDMGYEDYFFSDSMCFIEWPEIVESLLPEETVRLVLTVLDNGNRQLTPKVTLPA
jgi:tRNA threonylcarbamoyladenosine biosynthesis protein TsaE